MTKPWHISPTVHVSWEVPRLEQDGLQFCLGLARRDIPTEAIRPIQGVRSWEAVGGERLAIQHGYGLAAACETISFTANLEQMGGAGDEAVAQLSHRPCQLGSATS